MTGLLILLFVFCLALSFLLSGMEAGVFALNRLRIRHLMRRGNPRARTLYGYLENTEDFLWTILVGNSLANVVVVSVSLTWLHRWLGRSPGWLLAVLAAGILVFYAVCELLPKMLFRLNATRLCLALAVPFRLVDTVLRPLVAPMAQFSRWLMRWTGGRRFTGHLFGNRDELRLVMRESAQGLSGEERAMINRVLDLQHLTVRQITTPLSKAVTVTTTTPVTDVIALARERGFNRLPVWNTEGPKGRIAGMVSLRSLLYEEPAAMKKTASEYLKPALYLNDEARLEVALRQMQRTDQRLAVVLDRGQRELGVVSLEDILKVIFGDVKL
jgi:CBS domain containing-hemolysin-like protein